MAAAWACTNFNASPSYIGPTVPADGKLEETQRTATIKIISVPFSAAAAYSGVSRRSFQRTMRRLGIEFDAGKDSFDIPGLLICSALDKRPA